jgi:hypothetical protein
VFSRYKALINPQFDALNVIDKSKEMYKLLNELNEDAYLEIAKKTYKEVYPTSETPPDREWLLALLLGYDVITRYIYEHEIDRKRARFVEALIATKNKQQEFASAAQHMWKQTAQYGITVTDEALMQAFIDTGVKKVRWITENDSKVCEVCKSRSNKIYPIEKAPKKTHYGCRCYYEAVKEGEDDED